LDYGQTIHAKECEARPGTVGTIPYLAPEMEDARYGHSVDIWASGVVGLLLFVTDGSLEWGYVVREKNRYTQRVQSLQTAPRDSVENLLLQMLLWDPSQRPTAATTLKHSCFATLLDTARDTMSQNPRSKRGAPT
jgi:serine/threonine protein kinase